VRKYNSPNDVYVRKCLNPKIKKIYIEYLTETTAVVVEWLAVSSLEGTSVRLIDDIVGYSLQDFNNLIYC